MECYVYGYPLPKISYKNYISLLFFLFEYLIKLLILFLSWYKEQSDGHPNAKYMRPIRNSRKYFFEETIPEMSICTDCILSRLTIINVEHNDIGGYYINVTSSGFQSTSDKIELYSK